MMFGLNLFSVSILWVYNGELNSTNQNYILQYYPLPGFSRVFAFSDIVIRKIRALPQ